MSTRQAGTLVASEEWWRDHYGDLESRGYRLRPRYHPSWEPSWTISKKHFFTVEDGQATIVCFRISYSLFYSCSREDESRDGRRAHSRQPPSYAQESIY